MRNLPVIVGIFLKGSGSSDGLAVEDELCSFLFLLLFFLSLALLKVCASSSLELSTCSTCRAGRIGLVIPERKLCNVGITPCLDISCLCASPVCCCLSCNCCCLLCKSACSPIDSVPLSGCNSVEELVSLDDDDDCLVLSTISLAFAFEIFCFAVPLAIP